MALDFGSKGTYITSAQGATAGNFSIINCLEDAVISVVSNWTNAASPQSVTMVQGQTVYGIFTTVTVTSGTVVAY